MNSQFREDTNVSYANSHQPNKIYFNQPVSHFEIPSQWSPHATNHPVGLEALDSLNKIVVKQKKELLEALTGWETNNKYVILNPQGQLLFYAFEKTDTCMRLCCGAQRGFTIHIVNSMNQEVLRISREFKCYAGCCWCAGFCEACSHIVQISLPTSEVLGYVKQGGSCWSPYYNVLDENLSKIMEIRGPCCIFDGPCCPCESTFQILANDGNQIGKVEKIYSGFVQEMFTDADNFFIEFPPTLNIKAKSTLIGALFLIDFMYFEKQQSNNNN